MRQICSYIIIALLFPACSTIKNLEEGQTLYTGINKIHVENGDPSNNGENAMEEIEAALDYPPNNALFGSSSIRTPMPVGLWAYNRYVNSTTDFGRWMFNTFAKAPVYIEAVNPEIRTKVARNILNEYGYFNGSVSHEVIPDRKSQKKAKIDYFVKMNEPYVLDSIRHIRFRHRADTIMQRYRRFQLLRTGDNFNVITMEEERQRIAKLMRNEGYFFFRPEHIVYQADTMIAPGKVSLRVMRKEDMPRTALRPWKIGEKSISISGYENESPTDSMKYKDITIYYEGKLRARPEVLHRLFKFETDMYYSELRHEYMQNAINRLGMFRYSEMTFTPTDTTRNCETLNLHINAAYDLPWDGEMEFNMKTKSNSQIGPGIIFGLTRRNLFGGGEVLNTRVNGTYEWETGRRMDGAPRVNSYEVGVTTSLTFPRVVFPGLTYIGMDNYSSSIFSLNANQLNRTRFFKMLSLGGSVSYEYKPTFTSKHNITPFRLTYTKLTDKTIEFNNIIKENPILGLSFADQFIPAMSYTYTYEGRPRRRNPNKFWWEFSVTEAGNIISGVYGLSGRNFNEQGKTIMGNPFAQFLKVTNELRYTRRLDRNQNLVARAMAGVIYSYGNSRVAPFSEQFYIGGANSIRAFTIRSIGPGRFMPEKNNIYSYIDQTGDIKFEANLEYRFRIAGDLHGATFLDAGNIWLLKKNDEDNRPGGHISEANFLKDLALGTGVGLRYDMDFLVVRFDLGVALHIPYDTGKSGYFNLPRFKDGYGLHLAIGYPF